MLSTLNALTDAELTCDVLKPQLRLFAQDQQRKFCENPALVAQLLQERSAYIDALLRRLWQPLAPTLALVAVGGYGRCELHPWSDIDLLVLRADEGENSALCQTLTHKICDIFTLLWDLDLHVGHSFRTLAQCKQFGQSDVRVATSLQEARLICGERARFLQLKALLQAPDFWPLDAFFTAKVAEQNARHSRFHNTTYNLEPDLKSSPGCLRDIHTVTWLIKRSQQKDAQPLLSDSEQKQLELCQQQLWQLRFALHLQTTRPDNRLTFTHQTAIAKLLGYQGETHYAVEQMMKNFYRTSHCVSELNHLLLNLFSLSLSKTDNTLTNITLDCHFYKRGTQIAAFDLHVFTRVPATLLTLFLHIADDPSITTLAAPTLRAIKQALSARRAPLQNDPVARTQFIKLLQHPHALARALPLLHQHDVLAAYLPDWQHVSGLMQFNLFHAYTVDEHTMRLLAHFHFFSLPDSREVYPLSHAAFAKLDKLPLILAALFHDIGKGEKGDHSEIGSQKARQFCKLHDLCDTKTELVVWLVAHHLTLSTTAQRKDLHDPQVIDEFAKTVQTAQRLSYLLCLTVADINATNPTLWNSWKKALISELYTATLHKLENHAPAALSLRSRIRQTQQNARLALQKQGAEEKVIQKLWQRLPADYFLRHRDEQIIWHSLQILQQNSLPHVVINTNQHHGSDELFVYTHDKPALFSRIVRALDRKKINVHDAQIITSKDGFTLDTFVLLNESNKPIAAHRHSSIIQAVKKELTQTQLSPLNPLSIAKLEPFNFKARVHFAGSSRKHTVLELVALDTPGLLARIGAVFAAQKIVLRSARIATVGERAENQFILANEQRQALSDSDKQRLKNALLQAIS
ncbi:MAG: [protein-PII] uridylyltransferase [Vibrionaceae bacterium]